MLTQRLRMVDLTLMQPNAQVIFQLPLKMKLKYNRNTHTLTEMEWKQISAWPCWSNAKQWLKKPETTQRWQGEP